MTNPKGPLPTRVYWTRRALALVLALALVFGVGRLLGGSTTDDSSASARPASAEATSFAPSAGVTLRPSPRAQPDPKPRGRATNKKQEREKEKREEAPPAAPTGVCEDSDVLVTPSLENATEAGRNVVITLELTTLESPACYFEVTPETVVLRLTSGTDPIWTTQDCVKAMPLTTVVPRKEDAAEIEVTWSGMRSDDECTRSTLWAEPGYYHATAAVFGGEPTDVQFLLEQPTARTIVPEPKRDRDRDRRPEEQDRRQDRKQDRKQDRRD